MMLCSNHQKRSSKIASTMRSKHYLDKARQHFDFHSCQNLGAPMQQRSLQYHYIIQFMQYQSISCFFYLIIIFLFLVFFSTGNDIFPCDDHGFSFQNNEGVSDLSEFARIGHFPGDMKSDGGQISDHFPQESQLLPKMHFLHLVLILPCITFTTGGW